MGFGFGSLGLKLPFGSPAAGIASSGGMPGMGPKPPMMAPPMGSPPIMAPGQVPGQGAPPPPQVAPPQAPMGGGDPIMHPGGGNGAGPPQAGQPPAQPGQHHGFDPQKLQGILSSLQMMAPGGGRFGNFGNMGAFANLRGPARAAVGKIF